MAVSVIPPRFSFERVPVHLSRNLLVPKIDMEDPPPFQSVSNDDSWNGVFERVLRNIKNSSYMRHPNPPPMKGLTPDLISRAEEFVCQEMLIGQSLPSPAVNVQTWAFGFQYAHLKAIRCRQDKIQAHRFDISGSNGTHGIHGRNGSDGSDGQAGLCGFSGSHGLPGGDGEDGQNGMALHIFMPITSSRTGCSWPRSSRITWSRCRQCHAAA
jgi:hypothetical protein